MKVFISWSGARSKQIAVALNKWIPNVLQDVRTFMSEQDISAGSRWNDVVNEELEATDYGVLCLTQENLAEPWVLFEAGSLAKALEDAHVVPYVWGIDPAEVPPPLGQFQGVRADEEGTFKLIESINGFRENGLDVQRLKETFDKWWPDLRAQLGKVGPPPEGTEPREPREIMLETLQIVRGLAKRTPSTLEAADVYDMTGSKIASVWTQPSSADKIYKHRLVPWSSIASSERLKRALDPHYDRDARNVDSKKESESED